jgi:hypothetical protein
MATDLKTQIANFKNWLSTDAEKASKWKKERKERLAWYREHLTKEKLGKFSAEDFATLVKNLWAVNIWQNKDYKVAQLVKDNGLDKLRSSLVDVLYGTATLNKRWDDFRKTIKGLGPSSLSEILTFFDPQQYALANLKPYRVLPLLGLNITPVNDGKSYEKALEAIGHVKKDLEKNNVPDTDFILTDFFIAYLFYEEFDLEHKRKGYVPKLSSVMTAGPAAQARASQLTIINSHESAEAVLIMLGNLLGYDTYTPDAGRTYKEQKLGDIATLKELPYFTSEKIMDSVQNIDVVWLKDDWPEYFFEVEHTTGVTSGLLRIFQAQKLSTKFFILGPKDVLKKFEKEVEKAPFKSVRQKYQFRSYEELGDMYLATSNYRSIADKFLG